MWLVEVIKGLKQFLYEGSLHGVKYIFEPTFTRKERITWVLMVVISIALCAVNVLNLYTKWRSTPFVNVIDSLPTPIWAIPFPSVILCPYLLNCLMLTFWSSESTKMYCKNACLGADCALEDLKVLNERLNSMVIDQVNGSQELAMINTFTFECSEYRYKKSLEERISEVSSWRWVLEDLSKRLEESIAALQHEHNALRVVVQRVESEIENHSREHSRPGAMNPLCDQVEESILEELKFLREQKRKFENMIPEVDKQRVLLEKTKKKIVADVFNKGQAISVDETNSAEQNVTVVKDWKKKRKKGLPVIRWEKRCAALKRAGLRALANAIITRQQVRGARIQLSIAAQSYAAKVDSALRRRLHSNRVKLQDLNWQREEAVIDYKSLDEELSSTEQNIIQTMDQERLVEARLANRTLRPGKELIKDEVDKRLQDELAQIKQFLKELRNNMARISSLQNQLANSITKIDCCAEDLVQVIRLDEDRIRSRIGEVNDDNSSLPQRNERTSREPSAQNVLDVIQEEDDEDDYPFDS